MAPTGFPVGVLYVILRAAQSAAPKDPDILMVRGFLDFASLRAK